MQNYYIFFTFADTEIQKEDTKNETLAEVYGKFRVSEGKDANKNNNNDNKNTKTTITQTTQIVKEEQPKGWWGKLQKIKTITFGILAYVGYTTFAVGGVSLAAETVGLTKFAKNKLGIDETVARNTIIGSGVLGATAAVAESLMK